MTDYSQEAFLFWFQSKYGAENIGDNCWAFSRQVSDKTVPVFLYMLDELWSVACPFRMLNQDDKQNLYEIMLEHSDQSAMGLVLIGDMLCIVDCSLNFNAADADSWITTVASHAAELMVSH